LLFDLIYQIDNNVVAQVFLNVRTPSGQAFRLAFKGKGRILGNFMKVDKNENVEYLEFSSEQPVEFLISLWQ
jgi:hypothetical protein